jgi:hypothetical protein
MLVTAAASAHSPGATILMVVAVVLLGIVVGIVPVVIVRLVAGGRRTSPARHRPEPRIFEPAPPEAPVEPPPPPAPITEPLAADPQPEPLVAARLDAVSERHRDLYDEEYARQVDRVETLRRTIRTRLTVGADE